MFVSVGSTIVDFRLIGKKGNSNSYFFSFIFSGVFPGFTGGFFAGSQGISGIF
jgi:hypothetical protein